MNCKESGCSCQVLPSRGYCTKHGGHGRLLKEKLQKVAEKNREKNQHRSRFQADGRVRPGMGLKKDAEKRRQAFFRTKALVEVIGEFFKKIASFEISEQRKAA